MTDAETYRELAELGTATVYEANRRTGLLDLDLEQLLPGTRVAGPARIAACGQNDNWAVHKVMSVLQPGEVLLLTMPEPKPVALVGDLLLTQAKVHGAVGVLVNASTRDVDDVQKLGLPVWTRWRRVRGADKADPGAVDVPVTVGGQLVRPGDVLVLDADGAVVIASDDVPTVLLAARERVAREAALREKLQAGELSYDLHGLREKETQS